MMRITFLASFLIYGNIAVAFDINEYCRLVAESVGGSYVIEEGCRQQEQQAKRNVSASAAPRDIVNYCRDVGQAVGGSYAIMDGCIQQELAAKRRLSQ